jgi:hypothetical protein
MFCLPKIIVLLKVEPQIRCCAERSRKPKRHIWSHRASLIQNLSPHFHDDPLFRVVGCKSLIYVAIKATAYGSRKTRLRAAGPPVGAVEIPRVIPEAIVSGNHASVKARHVPRRTQGLALSADRDAIVPRINSMALILNREGKSFFSFVSL